MFDFATSTRMTLALSSDSLDLPPLLAPSGTHMHQKLSFLKSPQPSYTCA